MFENAYSDECNSRSATFFRFPGPTAVLTFRKVFLNASQKSIIAAQHWLNFVKSEGYKYRFTRIDILIYHTLLRSRVRKYFEEHQEFLRG